MPRHPQPEMESGQIDRVSLGFGNLYASLGDHIGHFYQTRAEWQDLMIAFLKAGLDAGEKCVYLISPGAGRQAFQAALADAGVDVEGAMASGRLLVDEGKNDPKAMQDALGNALAEVPTRFPLLRWGADMTWALKKFPTTEKLMEWETHCNVVQSPPAVFLCQYDLTAFLGHVVMDALRTHPICIVSNAIHQNPYYETPEAFLERLRRRDTTSLAS